MTEAVGRLGTLPHAERARWRFRFPMDPDRRSGRAGGLARDRAADLPGLAELPHAADRGAAGRVHARQFPHRLFQRRDLRAVRQFGDLRRRHRGVRAGGRHRARLDERAHQHAVQEAVLRALDHPAGDPRHPVHGGVDAAGEPEDRAPQRRAAVAVRHRLRVLQHLHHGGDDLGRRAALFADRVPADDRGVPLHGPVARGIRADERRLDPADRLSHHLQARLAGGARLAADPVRARDRIVRGAGAARAAGRHPRLYLGDLPGDPPVSEPDRARVVLCDHAAGAVLLRHLSAVAAVLSELALLDRHRQGLPPAHHRPRPLALVRGVAVRALLRRHRAAAVPGAGVDVAAEILQRAVLGRAQPALVRQLPRRARLSRLLDHGAQQPVPVADLRRRRSSSSPR